MSSDTPSFSSLAALVFPPNGGHVVSELTSDTIPLRLTQGMSQSQSPNG
jgi:hypothetical protein